MSIRTFLGGVGFGAALLYFLDPKEGERRRTLLRDGAQRALKGAEEAMRRAKEQIASQAAAMQGAAGAARAEAPAGSDAALEEQVRAAIAEISSHPAAIDVMVQDGRVELEGTILASERGPLVARLTALPGVLDVGDYLDEVEESDVRTDLQG